MQRHSPPIPEHRREPHEIEIAGVGGLYLMAIGVAILIGFVGGLAWIGWKLIQLHVLE